MIDWASWWLQVPDVAIGWLPYGVLAALWAAQQNKCRAIYSSAPHWTAHLIGLIVSCLTDLPWVADFRDPWRANPFREIGQDMADHLDSWLEAQVVRRADRVVCNSDFIRNDFIARYPDRAERFVTINNGFDPEDFEELEPRRPEGAHGLVMTHAGVFYGRRNPEFIFQALRLLRDREYGWARRGLCLQLVGPTCYEGEGLKELADFNGVGDLVRLTGPVAHRHALELMRGSDIQVLIAFNGPGAELQVPAKLYEYMGVGRPILALAPERSAIGAVMKQSGIIGELCDPEDPQAIAVGISRLAAGGVDRSSEPLMGDIDRVSTERFHRSKQVERIAELLEESCQEHD